MGERGRRRERLNEVAHSDSDPEFFAYQLPTLNSERLTFNR